MLEACLIALPIISMPIMKSKPDRGHPCLTPLDSVKCVLAKPLLSTQLEIE